MRIEPAQLDALVAQMLQLVQDLVEIVGRLLLVEDVRPGADGEFLAHDGFPCLRFVGSLLLLGNATEGVPYFLWSPTAGRVRVGVGPEIAQRDQRLGAGVLEDHARCGRRRG